jgi:uncharacterized protein (DUF1697 family)
MNTCISFLRGVNMSGHNQIRMTDLGALYNDLGFIRPETYIQSGNVIFGNREENCAGDTAAAIEKAILERFGFIVPVMIRSIAEMIKITAVNPFLTEENFDPSKMAVIFLHENTSEEQLRKVSDVSYPPDKFAVIGSEIFTYCPNGFGRTKLYTNFFEKKMNVKGTARNWNTVSVLLNIAMGRESE